MRKISDEFRDAVLFLNEHSTAVFLALELGYFREADLEILIPTLYGQEMADRKARTSTRTTVKDADTVVVAAQRVPLRNTRDGTPTSVSRRRASMDKRHGLSDRT